MAPSGRKVGRAIDRLWWLLPVVVVAVVEAFLTVATMSHDLSSGDSTNWRICGGTQNEQSEHIVERRFGEWVRDGTMQIEDTYCSNSPISSSILNLATLERVKPTIRRGKFSVRALTQLRSHSQWHNRLVCVTLHHCSLYYKPLYSCSDRFLSFLERKRARITSTAQKTRAIKLVDFKSSKQH